VVILLQQNIDNVQSLCNIDIEGSDEETQHVSALLLAKLWLKLLFITPLCLKEEFMGLIKWKKEYSIGVTKLDNQHKKILKIVNQVIGQQFSTQNEKEIEEILDYLQNYIKEHFKAEEEYMLKHQYSGYEEQRNEHNQFTDRLFEAQKEHFKYGRVTSINIINFVWDWFSQHILIFDKQLSKIG
jgi:hemerythrin